FIMGVECDGAMYHSSHSARDRDRLRQAVLEKMGWRIYRIWSPDWIQQRNVEITKLKNAIENARFQRQSSFVDKISGAYSSEPLKVSVVKNCPKTENSAGLGKKYSICDLGRYLDKEDFYSSSSGQLLRRQLELVIKHEAPIHTDLLFRRVMSRYHLEKMGDKIQTRLIELLRVIIRANRDIHIRNSFVYADTPIIIRYPSPELEESLRDIEYIAPEEMQDCMVQIVKLHSGMTEDCLFTEVLKFFGFKRQTDSVVKLLKQNVKKLLNSERIHLRENFLIE
ncbi:MAG: DUF3320 domain-containing protein, partial [Candidatus Omnitrophica bacterium]|nr:DUF3320 domain-containing protein [Candidatus Omnitrophota bacterium]